MEKVSSALFPRGLALLLLLLIFFFCPPYFAFIMTPFTALHAPFNQLTPLYGKRRKSPQVPRDYGFPAAPGGYF